MQVRRVLSIAVVSVASVIVIVTGVFVLAVFAPSGHGKQQNFAPSEGRHTISPISDTVLLSKGSGSSSFLYRKRTSTGTTARLREAAAGIESEPSFSHNGKLVVYSYAESADSQSTIWIVGADGSSPHSVTGLDEDALHPVFSPDDTKVFYAASTFTGHYSPVVRPARHDWDLFSRPVALNAAGGTTPSQITHSAFYELRSLDVEACDIKSGGTKILISTTEYPIGAMLEEFAVGCAQKGKLFQPHVAGESTVGPEYGEARFIHHGMYILFLAATNTNGGNFDYNVFSMSDVTGSEIHQLTQLRGMTTELQVLPDGRATFANSEQEYVLDVNTKTVKPL